ncbi:class III lanthionine synthetase LanKC [Streptomyces sp. NPDC057638]|uniref:class III lanthionine synthetase LanKC n=1 Tax=Streptomyces sp. NPDC057638 TaxID=3346190 RepID=UPI00367D44F3
MAVDWTIFVLSDPVFFAPPEEGEDQEVFCPPQFAAVPEGWRVRKQRMWSVYAPQAPTALSGVEQGWKIHVSATQANADKVLEIVAGHCLDTGVAFKHLGTRRVLEAMNSKYAPRAGSGKFIAIYPRDEAEFERCATELAERLAGMDGPYVLTDCRWGEGPVYFRYGAFTERWCWTEDGAQVLALTGADGTPVPDRRQPFFQVPDGVSVPAVLQPHIDRRAAPSGDIDYTIDEVLHFSNGGGVYGAVRRSDGRRVILKEARPHAGTTTDGGDAVVRLGNEERILRLLQEVPGVPEAHESFTFGGHRMLAMERMEGMTLQRWLTLNHPVVNWATSTPGAIRDYTRRAEGAHAAIAALLRRLHTEGVVFGDLHPGNILIEEDRATDGPNGGESVFRIAFVDFEMAFPAGEPVRPVLGFPGFTAREKTGTDVDEHSLAVLHLWFYLPTTSLLNICPAKAETLIAEAERIFAPPPEFGESLRSVILSERDVPRSARARRVTARAGAALDGPDPDWTAVRDSLARAIHATATPGRADRLFPGDPLQFSTAPGSFAHGAAGVLWALTMAGDPFRTERPAYEEWLVRSARAQHIRPGFYDGAHGVAHVLDLLGRRAEADELIERHRAQLEEVTDVSLHSGLAGIGLNLLHLADGPGHPYRAAALAIGERLSAAVHDGRPHGIDTVAGETGTRAGLLRGWSGVALFLLRLYETTGDKRRLETALAAVHRDLDLCVEKPGGVLHVDGGYRALTYLEIGAGGIALVADLLADATGDPRVTGALPGLARAARAPYVLESQLFNGRAGLLAVSHAVRHHLSGVDADPVAEHLAHLHWNALAYDGHVAFPGRDSLRLSMDLATGNAGVLAVLSSLQRGGHPPLPFLKPGPVPARR